MVWQAPKASTCEVCTKAVFYMEKVVADEKAYHKTCFKCNKCKKTLSTGTYASLDGKLFCKPHFKQLFKLKGRYNFAKDGAGERNAPSSVSVSVPKNINAVRKASRNSFVSTGEDEDATASQQTHQQSSKKTRRPSAKTTAVHARFAKLTQAPDSSSLSQFLPSSRFGLCTTSIKRTEEPKRQHFATSNSSNTSRASSSANLLERSKGSSPPSKRASIVDHKSSRKASAAFVVKGSTTPDVRPPSSVSGKVNNIRSLFEKTSPSTKSIVPNFISRRSSSKSLLQESNSNIAKGTDDTCFVKKEKDEVKPNKAISNEEEEEKPVFSKSVEKENEEEQLTKEDKNFSRRGSTLTARRESKQSWKVVREKKSVLSAVAMFESMVQSADVSLNSFKPRHICVGK